MYCSFKNKNYMNLKNYAVVLGLCLFSVLGRAQLPGQAPSTEKARKLLSSVKHGFTENKGQIRDQAGHPAANIRYLLQMNGLNVQLRKGGFSYDAYVKNKQGETQVMQFHRVDIDLVGADLNAALISSDQVPGSTMNVIGDNGGYQVNEFGKVTYRDIYPGIDLEFIARATEDKPVEYNFIVHPGADASRIRMKYHNGSDIALVNGQIEMKLAFGKLKDRIPASYTEQDGKSLAVTYQLKSDAYQNLYAFNVPAYDRNKTLVIDPTPDVEWATYYGTAGDDRVLSVALDDVGGVYIAGFVTGAGIGTTGAYQSTYTSTGSAGMVARFTASGKRTWCTYYLGSGANNVALNSVKPTPSGDAVYACGVTAGALSQTPNGFKNTYGGGNDGVVIKLNASGGRVWDTYYGGTANDHFTDLTIGSDGSVYVFGSTASTGLASGTGIHQAALAGGTDALLVKFSAAGARTWATYFGGSGGETPSGISIDANDYIYLCGRTNSSAGIANNVTEGQTYPVGSPGFIASFNPANASRRWGRYFGGTGGSFTSVTGIAVDKANSRIYAVGHTQDDIDITTSGAFQETRNGFLAEGFLIQLNMNGERTWGTYLSATYTGIMVAEDVKTDAQGNAYVLGYVAPGSATYNGSATECSFKPVPGSVFSDLFINKFTAGGARIWGTLYGSTGTEDLSSTRTLASYHTTFAVDAKGNVYAGGRTTEVGSTLSTAGAFQPINNAASEGILVKLTEGYLPTDFKVAASTIAPLTQNACALGVPLNIVGNSINGTNPPEFSTGIFYQWQTAASATGPWTDLAGEVFKDLTPPTGSSNAYFRRLVKANNGYCNLNIVDSSAAALVNITGNVAPTANANGPQWFLCSGNTVTLNGSATAVSPATISSYQWFAGNATTASAATATYVTSAITAATTYTLKVTDNNGCVALDQVNIIPVTANAGADANFCQGSTGVMIGSTPVSSNRVSYNWTLVSGTPVATALSCTNCAQPLARPLVASTYRLTVTVTRKDNTTCTSTDDVTITPVAAPNSNVIFAGTDKTICKNSTVVLGTTAAAAFTYNWTPGTYLSSTTSATPTFNAGTTVVPCPYNFTVTATGNGCTFYDQVSVSVNDPDINISGQTICGPIWANGVAANCSNATYSWQLVSGSGTVVSTRNGGADAYLKSNGGNAVFRRVTTLNGVVCNSGNVTVQQCVTGSGCGLIDIAVLSAQQCPKVFANTPLLLGVKNIAAADYNFSWSPANMVDNPTAATVNVTSTAQGTITVVVTNKYDPSITCTDNIVVNPAAWSLPVVNVSDKNTCPGTPVSIGTTNVAGYNYVWSPATGLNNVNTSNPTATLSTSAGYALKVTEVSTGCTVDKNVTVNVNAINFDAGPSRAVCNNGTATLGTTPGGSYTYSWAPANGAWQNGTNNTSANPQVLFAGASQSFTVTVSDPVSGCTLVDNVTLSGTVAAGSYAGPAAGPSCAGIPAQLGVASAPGASYLWTPATGLSATNVSNPIATPSTTTTYTVAVSYPGCNTALTDQVTVSVLPVTTFNFTDKTICPGTPVNIGVGGTGNPASIANAASYSWTPATGLSCSNCASPNASPQTLTTYTCTVTFANGCKAQDHVTVTPTFAASAKPDAVICSGGSVVLGQAAVGNVTYSWTPSTGLSSAAIAQPTASPSVTTDYTLTATGTGVNAGCAITDVVRVTVNVPTPFAITGNASLCAGGNTTIGFTPANINMLYQWSPLTGVASPNQSSTMVTPAGTQVYRLVQTDLATGCSNFQQIKVTVLPNTIAANADTTKTCVNNGVALPLSVTSAGTYTYSWLPASFLSDPFAKNPTTYASSTTTYTATITDNTSNCQLFVNAPLVTGVCFMAVSGSIFHDANGQSDNTVNSTAATTNLPTGMYVSLVDASNKIIATVAVQPDGTYNFENVPQGTYSLVLTNDPAGAVTPVTPAGWHSTGAHLGTGPGTSGNSGTLPNITVGTEDVTNANIAIQQPPVADPKTHMIATPVGKSNLPLTGTGAVNAPGPLSGTDPEDGIKGSGATFTITDLSKMNGNQLYYNGTLVVAGVPIPNYNPALLSVKFAGAGSTGLTFDYLVTDAAGSKSAPASYTISWGTALPLHLLSFTAVKADNAALLEWNVANEQAAVLYAIERSIDGKQWGDIGSEAGGQRQYQYYDKSPLPGTNYYRLRLIAKDGTYQVSYVRSLVFGMITNSVTIMPNPSKGDVLVQFAHALSSPATVRVINAVGGLLYQGTIAEGITSQKLTLNSLAAGIYVVYIQGADINEQVRLLLN